MTMTLRPRRAAERAQMRPAKLAPTITRSASRAIMLAEVFRSQLYRGDLVLALFEHFQAEAVKIENLTHFRNHPGIMDDKAGNGGGLLIREVPIQGTIKVAQRHGAFHDIRPVGLRLDARGDEIMLILDIADNLLNDVLKGDEALHFAILVNNNGEMGLAPEERLELISERARIGHEPGRAHDILDLDLS